MHYRYLGTQSTTDGTMHYSYKNSVLFEVKLVKPLLNAAEGSNSPGVTIDFPSVLSLQRYGPYIQGLYDRHSLPVHSMTSGGRLVVDDTVHVLLISVRTAIRYAEAETMLKSLLFHQRTQIVTQDSASDADSPIVVEYYRPLVIHIVTDESGRTFFSNLWRQYYSHDNDGKESHGSGSANITVVFHDFLTVCAKPLESLLTALKMHISAHHSGVAGYCRLFLPDYFSSLASPFVNPTVDFPLPSKLIVLETDQLVLAPISDLWDHMNDVFEQDEDVLVSAAENYQPWEDSRPTDRDTSKERKRESGNNSAEQQEQQEHLSRSQSVALELGVQGQPKAVASTRYHGKPWFCILYSSLLCLLYHVVFCCL